jgi:hypothetical protein
LEIKCRDINPEKTACSLENASSESDVCEINKGILNEKNNVVNETPMARQGDLINAPL